MAPPRVCCLSYQARGRGGGLSDSAFGPSVSGGTYEYSSQALGAINRGAPGRTSGPSTPLPLSSLIFLTQQPLWHPSVGLAMSSSNPNTNKLTQER